MNRDSSPVLDARALERAAKYICNSKDGLCPMRIEDFKCRFPCDLDTLPWQCWVIFFKEPVRGKKEDE